MGICIDKLPHSCGTRKGLQVYADEETGKVDGFCWSCNTYVANPYGKPKTIDQVDLPPEKTEEEIELEIHEISGLPSVDLKSRKLRSKDIDYLDIKVELSEEDGKTPKVAYCPVQKDGKTTGYYAKTLSSPSHQWSVGDVKAADPIGWDKAQRSGAYRLIITEGWFDACAVEKIYQRYGDDKEYHPAIISLPNGVNSVKSLSKHAKDINSKFKEVVLSFDNDEAGHRAVEEAMKILPNAMSVTLPDKDANECVTSGSMQAAYKAFRYQAAKPKNTRLINLKDIYLDAREPTPYGELTWPFPTMNNLLRNVRLGETIYIGAGVKMGKSDLLNCIAANFMAKDEVPVLLVKPEEQLNKTTKRIAGKMVGRVFDDPKVEFDYEAYDQAFKIIDDKAYVINLYQHLGWDTLKLDIVAAAAAGCKAVFIDPITNLTNGIDSATANTQLQEIAQELSAMAIDLNIVIFIFCHLKAPEGVLSKQARAIRYKNGQFTSLGNCSHELGGDIISSQFAGSRAMMRSCNLMLGLSGNKDPDLDEDIRRRRWINILEDREFNNNENIPIIWNRETQLYSEV